MLCGDDKERFARICREMLSVQPDDPNDPSVKIGTYREKRLHKALKRFVCEDLSCHEIDMGQRYIADLMVDGEIYEIQTGSLFPMKKKLQYYLDTTGCHVTIVHPIPAKKYLVWIDPVTGKAGKRHPSPKKADALTEFYELVYIAELVKTGRIGVWLLLIEEEEYRFLDGWSRDKKRGSNRYERLPVDLLDEMTFFSPDDYRELLPPPLPDRFTVADFARAARIAGSRHAYMAVRALEILGILEKDGVIGRAACWKKT